MSNPILRGIALSTEFYRSHRLENYKTDEGQAIRVLDCLSRTQFISYGDDLQTALAEAKSRIDQELEGSTDEIPF
jgi:hypothetical protein